jgi:PAS domain S-box-containing protein
VNVLSDIWLTTLKSRKTAMVFVLIVLTCVALASYIWAQRYAERQSWVSHTYQVLSELNALGANLNAAASARRGYILSGDTVMLGDMESAVQSIQEHLRFLEVLTSDNPQQQDRLVRLFPLVQERIDIWRKSVDLSERPQSTPVQPSSLSDRAAELDEKIALLLKQLKETEEGLLYQRNLDSAHAQSRFTAVLILTYLIAAAILIYVFLRMTAEVSRRTRAEEAAKENEERFRLLVNSVQDYAIIRLDSEGKITTWNRGAERMFGYTSQEIVDQPWHRLFETCDHDTPTRHLAKAFADGHIQDDCLQVRKDGTTIWVTADLTLLRNGDGQPRGYALITRDITERRQHLKEIEQRDAQLNAFFSNAPVGLAIIDKNLRFQRMNEPFSKLNRLSADESREIYVKDLTNELAAQMESLVRAVAATGTPVLNHEVKGQPPSNPGTVGWWLKSFFPITKEDGVVTQIGAVVQDVTLLKRAENTVRWLSGRLLQSRDDERRRLARDLHDSLGQILTAVKMNLSYLSRETNLLDERGRNAVGESKDLIDSCLKEVRTLSHLLHPPMLDEVGLLPAIRWFVTGFSQRSGIEVTLQLPATLRRLPVEAEIAVFRAVQESLTNVHRHSGSPTATVRLAAQNGEIQLQVTDEGCGIAPQKLAARNENSMIGIGILGMRERMRQLGGQMEISSANKGTSVYVSLPIKEVA